MSKNTRWALAIVGLLIVVAAAVVIGTGRDDTDATPTEDNGADVTTNEEGGGATGSGASGASGASGDAGSGGDAAHPDDGHSHDNSGGASPSDSGKSSDSSGGAGPAASTGGSMVEPSVVSPILVVGKEPTIKAKKGEVVMIRAKASRPATLHLHGYDKTMELTPRRVGNMRVRATIDGEFEIAFHFKDSEVHIGKLRVSP